MRYLAGVLLGPALLLSIACSSGAFSADEPNPIVASGASFLEPKGWQRLKSDKPKTKGWFISKGSDPSTAKAMIMVDIGPPTAPDLETTAAGLARNWGGKVLAEKTKLDGVEAIRVRVDKASASLQPVEGVVTIKNGRLYLLMGGAVAGESIANEIEEVRKGWRWVK